MTILHLLSLRTGCDHGHGVQASGSWTCRRLAGVGIGVGRSDDQEGSDEGDCDGEGLQKMGRRRERE
jgi:hypothetical protein